MEGILMNVIFTFVFNINKTNARTLYLLLGFTVKKDVKAQKRLQERDENNKG